MAETRQFLLSEEQYHKLHDILSFYCYNNHDALAYTTLISMDLQALEYSWI